MCLSLEFGNSGKAPFHLKYRYSLNGDLNFNLPFGQLGSDSLVPFFSGFHSKRRHRTKNYENIYYKLQLSPDN